MNEGNSEHPVTRVPAVIQPTGILRFNLSHERVEELNETLVQEVQTSSEEDMVTFSVSLDPSQATVLRSRVEDLLSNRPMVGVAPVDATENPEYGIDVMVSEDKLKQITLDTPRSDDGVTHEFELSRKAAWLVSHQLQEALDGAVDPSRVVDMGEVRATMPDG